MSFIKLAAIIGIYRRKAKKYFQKTLDNSLILNNCRILFANYCEKCNNCHMKTLKIYIQTLLGQGKYFFSKQEALSDLSLSPSQFQYQASG